MVDFVSKEKRSKIMRGSRSKDTRPEMTVRRLLHALGYRYRLHGGKLAGKPDLVFGGRRKVIFVHGCFWHQHNDPSCRVTRMPASNTAFWQEKFSRNKERDNRNVRELESQGWRALTVWECEIPHLEMLRRRLTEFLES